MPLTDVGESEAGAVQLCSQLRGLIGPKPKTFTDNQKSADGVLQGVINMRTFRSVSSARGLDGVLESGLLCGV